MTTPCAPHHHRLIASLLAGGLLGCLPTPSSDDDAGGDGTDTTSGDDGGSDSAGDDSQGDQDGSGDGDTTAAETSTSSGSTGGADTSGSDDTTGGLPACPASTHECVGQAPADWQGPVALRKFGGTDPVPGCGAGWDTSALGPVGTVDFVQGTCDCDCGTAVSPTCADIEVWNVDVTCKNMTGATLTIPDDGCIELQSQPTNFFLSSIPDVDGGSCSEATLSEMIPSWGWTDRALRCAASTENATCEDGKVCVPQHDTPFEAGLCIHREGDHDCPAGPYSNKTLYNASATDTRACDACDCQVSGTCTGTVEFVTGTDVCNSISTLIGSYAAGACGNEVGVDGIKAKLEPQGVCTSYGGSANGTVTPTEPVTICCAS